MCDHVAYAFQSQSTLYSCQNVKELRALNRCDIWNLSDSNVIGSVIGSHNHLVRKRTLNHEAKLAKWLSFSLRTKWLWVRMPLLCYIVIIFPMLQIYQYDNITFPYLHLSYLFQLNYRLFSKVTLNSNNVCFKDPVPQILTSHITCSYRFQCALWN